jgi:serine/threonine-protein kinase
MGLVYEALDPKMNRKVAIKTILRSNLDEQVARSYLMRFEREARAAARLNHPNIVQVFDFGEEGDVAYIVMELVLGKELQSFFDANERFPTEEAVRIMCELLSRSTARMTRASSTATSSPPTSCCSMPSRAKWPISASRA